MSPDEIRTLAMWPNRGWRARFAALGGIATTRDLHRFGLRDEEIRIHANRRWFVRVRPGWYALRGVDPAVVEACRLGGRLACVSALEYRSGKPSGDARLHIEVPANAVPRVPPDARDRVRVHWTRNPSPGDRAAVSVEAAERQRAACGREDRASL